MKSAAGLSTLRVIACALAMGGAAAIAQTYPAKPIRILVGNAPGGGIDITARAVGQKLTEKWGKSAVVDNRPGASGLIAMEVAAQSAADGVEGAAGCDLSV